MLVAILAPFDTGSLDSIAAVGSDQPTLDANIEASIRANSKQEYVVGCDGVYDPSQGTWWSMYLSLHPEIQIYTAGT